MPAYFVYICQEVIDRKELETYWAKIHSPDPARTRIEVGKTLDGLMRGLRSRGEPRRRWPSRSF